MGGIHRGDWTMQITPTAHLLRLLAVHHYNPIISAKATKENTYTTTTASVTLLVRMYRNCILINWCACYLYNLQGRVLLAAVAQ